MAGSAQQSHEYVACDFAARIALGVEDPRSGIGARVLAERAAATTIRRSEPSDWDAVGEMLSRCSQATLHLRFLSPVPPPQVGTPTANALTDIVLSPRHGQDIILVAVDGAYVVALAELRWSDDPAEPPEMAFLVEDARQGAGIGSRLVGALAEEARRAGVRDVIGHVFGDNRRMVAAFRRAGLRVELTGTVVRTLTIHLGDDDTGS